MRNGAIGPIVKCRDICQVSLLSFPSSDNLIGFSNQEIGGAAFVDWGFGAALSWALKLVRPKRLWVDFSIVKDRGWEPVSGSSNQAPDFETPGHFLPEMDFAVNKMSDSLVRKPLMNTN